MSGDVGPETSHGPDWSDSLPGEPPSCTCGYNGTPDDCVRSRRDIAAVLADHWQSNYGDGEVWRDDDPRYNYFREQADAISAALAEPSRTQIPACVDGSCRADLARRRETDTREMTEEQK